MHSGTGTPHVHHGNLTPGPVPAVVGSTRDRGARGHVLIPDLSAARFPDGGLCVDHQDKDLWSDDSKAGKGRAKAKVICRRCPVQPGCLAYARAARAKTLTWGVWGGVYFTDRRSEER